MPIAWFEAPYKTREVLPKGRVARYCALDDANDLIRADNGHWAETDIGGNKTVAKVRASRKTLTALTRDYGFQRVENPATVWRTERVLPMARAGELAFGERVAATMPLDLLDRAVSDDTQITRLRKLLDGYGNQADKGETVVLPAEMPAEEKTTVLILAGRRGYSLDRIRPGTFPTTSVLDTFPVDGGPPPDANWSTGYGGGAQGLAVTGGLLYEPTAAVYGDSWWNPNTFNANQEVGFTITSAQGVNSDCNPMWRLLSPGSAAADGYQCQSTQQAGTDRERLYVFTNTSFTQMGADIAQDYGTGTKIGVDAIGTTHTLYADTGGGWVTVDSRVDATWNTTGYICVELSGNNGRYDDFFGGSVVTTSASLVSDTPFTILGRGAA